MNTCERIVIIGGGQAAGWSAKTLRDLGYTKQLSVVADEPRDFYERPPLSKDVLAGKQEPGSLRLFSAEVTDALNIDWHRPRRATTIDRALQVVHLDNGQTLPYDRLLIATGSRPRTPDPSWSQIDGVMMLRDVEDALAIRDRLAKCRSLAVIGGGWIGLEIAALARSMSIPVVVYERAAALCGRSVGLEVAGHLAILHRAQGVALRLNCGDLALSANEQGGAKVTSPLGAEIYDTVIVGTGAQLNIELAQAAGLKMGGGGIVVDGAGRSSDPMIFAAGDVATHPVHGICVQSWANAQNQGMTAARGMLGMNANYDDVPWLWSDQYGTNIQILGVRKDGSHCIRRMGRDGMDVYFYLDTDDRLQHMVSFGDARAVKLGRRWMASERVLDPMELADPGFDLMSLR
jgi:3-phenylpropionate/trans-cinnamate dioxygenase ferredoxin reductase component